MASTNRRAIATASAVAAEQRELHADYAFTRTEAARAVGRQFGQSAQTGGRRVAEALRSGDLVEVVPGLDGSITLPGCEDVGVTRYAHASANGTAVIWLGNIAADGEPVRPRRPRGSLVLSSDDLGRLSRRVRDRWALMPTGGRRAT